ncbi:hypothetical protein [Paenibacillus sp.]|uniref:hypothetical protein n=1 Tax=Paenibacillus sp. TaxID=58172 RepID=UPI002D65F5BE|nr:hypothetical protein [Paenibacillus sp.]HZG55225.1 hypothetical protein [Paenibacillus sp.]
MRADRPTRVYGVDFSGAKDPSGKLYVAQGTLSADGGAFELESCVACDDRLDAFAMLLGAPDGSVWGFDAPFAPASPAYDAFGFTQWEEWLSLAAGSSRSSFLEALDRLFPAHETPCVAHGWACRHTDVACRAASPFKRVQPNLRAMVYAGWKWLSYARQAGCAVYPFDRRDAARSSSPVLFEVYPSYIARAAQGRRSLDVSAVAAYAQAYAGWREHPLSGDLGAASQDAVDACAACLTLAVVVAREGAALASGARPGFANDLEWEARMREGLIVRPSGA